MTEHGHGNRIPKRWMDPNPPTLKKVPASSVPYGESISTNGRTVWVALDGERIVCVAATADEARRKFKEIQRRIRGKAEGMAG